MAKHEHLEGREACPFLPSVTSVIRPSDIASVRKMGGADAYEAALGCAQSLWLQGLPAQAILQLNHAMGHDFGDEEPRWPMPYQSVVWILTRRHEEGFLGNPVRHFQHLATRMSGHHKELRIARAWLCFHLAESVLPEDEFPRDGRQMVKEGIVIPSVEEILPQIASNQERELVQLLFS